MSPTVSVIVPCYNLGAFLDEAVESVLAQTYQDFEILVVDDGSTDRLTRDLLERYDRPKTTVFHTANRGLAAARNFLIARATGQYLCALDADDRLHPEFLRRTVGAFEADPSLGFVSTRLRMFGTEDREWPTLHRCDLAALLSEDTVLTAALVRRDAVVALGGYDEAMPAPGDEDWDLWIRLVKSGSVGTILPEVLFFYRRRPGSMSLDCTSDETHLLLLGYLMEKHRDAYRGNVFDVLALKEEMIADLVLQNAALERDIATVDRPSPGDDEPGPAPTAEASVELAATRRELRRLQDEVVALRTSASWKLTDPLRRLYDLLTGSNRTDRS